ncbi:GNAT family N-acetyltransferase [Massilia sp. TS11]|uniref:GNAT family N-acetyltransferase n=1 Tax=Massilia sp. TS11 TaxID=2908003 RepID=UPI001EDB147E|nr:GNAT family N-acetyltransferase [Massilia sp. TS11]MCG2584776.1 GNAT family N-acetyltransferase [Massilia sp. TS11]
MTSESKFHNPIARFFGKRKSPAEGGKPPRRGSRTVLVKQLDERDRRRVLKHLLALDTHDRTLRFGSNLPDSQIEAYVGRIDFTRDTVYGVYNRWFRLVGVCHLAFMNARDVPPARQTTIKDQVAEFGVSVSKSARGLGIGSKLFERAAIRCRNLDIDTLYMHCLSSNATMMHLARKAGMEIVREYGEADAYLHLPPADPSSVLQEAVQEQFAAIDYALKSNARAAFKLFSSKK